MISLINFDNPYKSSDAEQLKPAESLRFLSLSVISISMEMYWMETWSGFMFANYLFEQ